MERLCGTWKARKICRTWKQKILQQGGGSGKEKELLSWYLHSHQFRDGGF
jgi:hypothetical protein